jgi:hypothetical protein
VPLGRLPYEIHSLHARGKALGLSTLSAQAASINPALGQPVAGLNGDFYKRDKAYAGAPRGLQISEGELLSSPSGGPSFWVDALGEVHAANVTSLFRVTWPDGTSSPFGLNNERRLNQLELYTPAIGPSTLTAGGRELVLERGESKEWLPLRPDRTYAARVRQVRESGNAPVAPDLMVLAVPPALVSRLQSIQPGAVLQISTGCLPNLRGIRTAISGGPVLLREGQRQKIRASPTDSFEFSSMIERHPRAALAWNSTSLFLVEVDGRQRDLSVGMTLDELSKYLASLGCQDALNLDGGGSATLWWQGEVRNSPCDHYERPIANSVVIVRKNPSHAASNPGHN